MERAAAQHSTAEDGDYTLCLKIDMQPEAQQSSSCGSAEIWGNEGGMKAMT
jgi:hypothetical protein